MIQYEIFRPPLWPLIIFLAVTVAFAVPAALIDFNKRKNLGATLCAIALTAFMVTVIYGVNIPAMRPPYEFVSETQTQIYETYSIELSRTQTAFLGRVIPRRHDLFEQRDRRGDPRVPAGMWVTRNGDPFFVYYSIRNGFLEFWTLSNGELIPLVVNVNEDSYYNNEEYWETRSER